MTAGRSSCPAHPPKVPHSHATHVPAIFPSFVLANEGKDNKNECEDIARIALGRDWWEEHCEVYFYEKWGGIKNNPIYIKKREREGVGRKHHCAIPGTLEKFDKIGRNEKLSFFVQSSCRCVRSTVQVLGPFRFQHRWSRKYNEQPHLDFLFLRTTQVLKSVHMTEYQYPALTE